MVIALGKRRDPNLTQQIIDGLAPRPEFEVLAEELHADIFDFDAAERSRHPLVRLARQRGGLLWALAALVFVSTQRGDLVYATGEDVALPLAAMFRFSGRRRRIVTVAHHMETMRRTRFARRLGHRPFRAIITLNTIQRNWLIDSIGWPAEMIHRLDYWCDTEFFCPPTDTQRAEQNDRYVFTCGMEARDYPTLMKAAAASEIPMRVVASGWSAGTGFTAVDVAPPGNVTVESGVAAQRLRELYQGAEIVVMALHDADHPAGITAVVEAMACAKPIVATASPGIADVVGFAVGASDVGTVVRTGDPQALVTALRALWDEPNEAAQLGVANRQRAQARYTNKLYASAVASLMR